METDRPYWDQIDAYLHGQLSREEEAAMEQAIREDAALAEEVRQHEKVVKGLRKMQLDALTAKAGEWEAEIKAEEEKEVKAKKNREQKGRLIQLDPRVWVAAAAVLILLALYFIFPSKVGESQQLAVNAFSVPEMQGTKGVGGLQVYNRGMDAFSENDFDAAVDYLRQVPPANEKYADAQFALGLSYFAEENYEDALTAFQASKKRIGEINLLIGVPPDNVLINYQHADWYIALSYLAAGQRSAGLQLLQEIREDVSHPFYAEAGNLLNQLD